MKIIVKVFGITHKAVLPDDISADEFVEVCAKLAESVGYSPSIVIEALRKAIDYRV